MPKNAKCISSCNFTGLFLPFAFNLFLDFLPHAMPMPIQKPLKAADRSDCIKIVENKQTYKQRESITPNEATAQE